MELSFEVKITPQVLYDYLLYHTYTTASGLLGSVVGALLVVAFFMTYKALYLIFGLIILLYLPWTLFLRSRKQYLDNSAFKEPLSYVLNEEGITVAQNEEKQTVSWDALYKAVSTSKSIIVYTSPVNATIFPKNDLGDKLPLLIETISTHMPAKKVKIRG